MEPQAHVTPTSSVRSPQERRTKELLRAYQRVLRRKPNTIEKAAMRRAALLTARAEAAAIDPEVTLDDLVRIDNLAARARARLSDLIGGVKSRPAGALTLVK